MHGLQGLGDQLTLKLTKKKRNFLEMEMLGGRSLFKKYEDRLPVECSIS